MPLGYAGKLLEVNLTSGKIEESFLEEEDLKLYIGGRGLAAKILWDRLGGRWGEIDPLGPENVFLALTGPLTGYYPGAKICVSGKSPQCNGIIGSTVAGEFAVELKCAGYDGIVVEGAAKNPVYIYVEDGKAEIRDASHLWGKRGRETIRILNKEIRAELSGKGSFKVWKEPGIMYIGPAGENGARIAAVMEKFSHAAGYGGYGGVMGSKRLKAIAAKGSGPLPKVADFQRVRELMEEVYRECYARDSFRRWGTGAGGYAVGADSSSEPVRNWQEEWHDERGFGVDAFERRVWVKRYWGDYGCPVTCLKVALVRAGPFKGAIADNPDYELQAYLGPNLGIFTPEGNVYLTSLIDDLGLDGIGAGNVMGFAAELYQRGLLTMRDLGGLDLRWGDVKAFASLAEKVARREGIGDLLAEGTYRAALKITDWKGVDVMKYAVHSKGVALGAHGVRSGLDYPSIISYACSVQAGDHTSPTGLPLTTEASEFGSIFLDSAVACSFIVPRWELLWSFLKAVTGWDVDSWCWAEHMAPRIAHIQRAALLLGGPDVRWDPAVHDDNPPRFYEPLPSGPKEGQAVDRAEVEKMKGQYYEAMGWDEWGIPKPEVLKRLGLEGLDKALEDVRRAMGRRKDKEEGRESGD